MKMLKKIKKNMAMLKKMCVYENGDSKGKIRTPEEILQKIYNTSEKDSFSYKL